MMEKLQPKLRFPEFTNNEEIKNYSFNDLFSFSTGKNIKQNEASPEFDIPCVRYGELYHMYNEVIKNIVNSTHLPSSDLVFSEGNEILLPSAGEDPLDIGSASALTLPNVAIGRTINILRPLKKDVYSQLFTSYYINHRLRKKISSLAKGVSISNVYNSDLKTLEILLPSLPEQQKIASFLTTVDDKISNLKQKVSLLEKYKKGVMQQIFSLQIRFKDTAGNDFPEWEEKSLGEVCDVKKGEQFNKEDLKETDLYPCINGGIEPSGYSHLYNRNENTITISEGGNSCGFINFIKTKFWCGGHCYTIELKNSNFNIDYLFQLLKSYQNEIMKLRVGSGLPNIQKKDLSSFNFELSVNIEEQTKIAEFLTGIDEKIETTKLQLSKMVVWKKGLLQGMFC